jgi:FAD/FMN-containing dehydrogenase
MERAFYGEEAAVVTPRDLNELADVVRFAEERGVALIPSGHGTHAYLGNPPPSGALVVSLRRLDSILRYEPDDFTLGVQAGVPLAELRRALLAHGQEIAIDFPSTAAGTIGGLVAVHAPGPRLGRHGPLRSAVIGARALRGGGRTYRSGGMVVKNVAGYDVAKFLPGSLGTAGILLEINFKLRPFPARRAARVAPLGSAQAAWALAAEIRAGRLGPAALTVLGGTAVEQLGEALETPALGAAARLLVVLLEGSAGAVSWQEEVVDRLLLAGGAGAARLDGDSALRVYDYLSAFSEPGLEGPPGGILEPPGDLGVARLGVLASATPSLEGEILEALGAGHGDKADKADKAAATAADALTGLVTARWRDGAAGIPLRLEALRSLAAARGATGLVLYLPPPLRRSWSYLLLPDRNQALAERVLRVFDPAGIFSPGRVHAWDADRDGSPRS